MTIFQFYKAFDTDKKCLDYLYRVRWGNGPIVCPYCNHPKCWIIEGGKRYKCANKKCYKRFHITVGTIFQAANVPMWQFFYMIFVSVTNKKNVSSYQQGINSGVTQKTCWYIMARIRMLCYQDQNLKLDGEVEVDETYLATSKWKRHDNKGIFDRKIPVLGLVQRGGGKVIINVIKNKNRKTVDGVILKHVEVNSSLFTDSAACYLNMSSYYIHQTINHKQGIYVIGNVHTNTIENVWSHLKKALVGVHHGVSLLHLQSYCDEFAYRWNNKSMSATEKFDDLIMRGCNFKPITNDKIRLGVKDNSKTIANKNAIVDTDTGEVFKSAKQAALNIGISRSYLSKMLREEQKNTTSFKKM